MSEIVDIYTDQIHDNLRPLHANWDIATPRQLGDYGELDGNLFIGLGNITTQFGIQVQSLKAPRLDTRFFSTKGSTSFQISAQGQAPAGGVAVNAKLDVSFSAEDAMFFNAAGCSYSMIQAKTALGAEIMRLYADGQWKKSWVVITDLVDSGALTVAISSSRDSSVTFEADAHVPAINLGDPQLKLSVKTARNSAFQLAAPEGKNILLGFCGIQGFFRPDFEPVKRIAVKKAMMTPPAPSDLFFGQMP